MSAKVVESVVEWVLVSDFHFQGTSALALDAKGRVTVPARHREVLQSLCEGRLTLTKHPSGCLMVFPQPAWVSFRDRVAALPMQAAGWKRVFLGSAMEVEIDSGSRVLVSPELRQSAGLTRDVLLIGMGSHLELWDAAKYAAHEAEVMAQPMPDVLQDFTF